MHHKFPDGSITLFLSNDLVPKVNNLTIKHKGKLDDFNEEARYDKFHYNVRNLDAFNIDSIQKMCERLK